MLHRSRNILGHAQAVSEEVAQGVLRPSMTLCRGLLEQARCPLVAPGHASANAVK